MFNEVTEELPQPLQLLSLEDGWGNFLEKRGIGFQDKRFEDTIKAALFLRKTPPNEWIESLSGLSEKEIRPFWEIVEAATAPILSKESLAQELRRTQGALILALARYYCDHFQELEDTTILFACAQALLKNNLFAIKSGENRELFPINPEKPPFSIPDHNNPNNQWVVSPQEEGDQTLVYTPHPDYPHKIGDQCFTLTPLGPGLPELRESLSLRGRSPSLIADETEKAPLLGVVYTNYSQQEEIEIQLLEKRGPDSHSHLEAEVIKIIPLHSSRRKHYPKSYR